MKNLLILTIFSATAIFTAACTGSQPATNTVNQKAATNTTSTTASNSTANTAAASPADETPALVKAAFADAQSFTTQHKDITAEQITQIEKDAGGKVPDKDHHSYLAFSTTGGARKQIGAATIVKADGKDVVIIYESKDGMPTIKEVRADGVPAAFLTQFAGKGHDDKFAVGGDLKTNGANEAIARAVAAAVRLDSTTMQTLYGKAHSH